MKHLSGLGDNWHLYVRPAMLTYNTYNTPTLDNLNPFELALGRKPILVPSLENTPHIPVTGTFAKAKQMLEQKLKYLGEKLQKLRDSRLALQNKDKEFHEYTVGQIVYMYHPGAPPACAAPTGSNSFSFAYVFAEKCPHRRLAAPQRLGTPQREILDPPLSMIESGKIKKTPGYKGPPSGQ